MTQSNRTLARWVAVAGLMSGCGAQGGAEQTGSQAMATSQDFSALYVVSPEDDLVVRVRTKDKDVEATELSLPGEPTRIARVQDRALVTLRANRQLAVLRDDGERLHLERTVDTGAEPYGVVASADGARVYVTESLEGRLLELDAVSLETLRSWPLAGEPRGLALHPSGRSLLVAGAREGRLYHVDLGSGDVEAVAPPSAGGPGLPMVPRITGDPAFSPNGAFVAVPTLFVELDRPADRRTNEYYGPGPGDLARFVPAICLYRTNGKGKPRGRCTPVRLRVLRLASYPSSVTFTPDSQEVIATMEGAQLLVSFHVYNAPMAEDRGLEVRQLTAFESVEGPRAIAFTGEEEAFVYGFLDRAVGPVPLAVQQNRKITGIIEGHGGQPITERRLDPDVEAGRRLFYSTRDPRVVRPINNVSCATCHFEGRDDGLTWPLQRGRRQTPSLAGEVSARAPVTWTGEAATVAEDAMRTSQTLMGGGGLSAHEAEQIARYIDFVRPVDVPDRADVGAAERGRALFESADVGCASCHTGAQLTDNQVHIMPGSREGFKTPSLRGLAATPPYLHDGSAPDLRSLLERAESMRMSGRPLDRGEIADMEAYLRTL